MKTIINGLRYNTETATEVASYESPAYRSDFGWYAEALYRTKNGRYFLAGEGNAASKYSEPAEGGNMSGPGSHIIVLSNEEAREWCERTGNVEALEQYFAAQLQDA